MVSGTMTAFFAWALVVMAVGITVGLLDEETNAIAPDVYLFSGGVLDDLLLFQARALARPGHSIPNPPPPCSLLRPDHHLLRDKKAQEIAKDLLYFTRPRSSEP